VPAAASYVWSFIHLSKPQPSLRAAPPPHLQGQRLLPDRTAQLAAVASSLEALQGMEGDAGACPPLHLVS